MVDPADSEACHRAVTRLASIDQHRVVCHPTPGTGGQRSLAMDLLVALGKDHDALAVERLRPMAWQLARSWLAGEQIRDLFVLRAHRLAAERWRDLLSLPAARGMRLWLVVHRRAPTPAQHATLIGTRWRTVSLAEFGEQWSDPPEPINGERSPMLPAESFLIFRALCHWTLAPEQFQLVDAAYRRALDETATWLRGWPERTPLSRPAVHAFLQRLTADCEDAGEALVRFRAAQAQLFREGWLVWAKGQEGAVFDPGEAVARLDRSCADRLRALADPRATALAVASLVSEAPLDSLLKMTVGDAGSGVMVINGHRYAVPPWAAGLVAALVHHRRLDGARKRSRLFLDSRGENQLGLRPAGGLLDHVADRTGIGFRVPAALPENWTPPASWLSLDALRLVEIGDPPERVSPWLSLV